MSQITNQILMIRPASFGYNKETAVNNEFQTKPIDTYDPAAVADRAVEEFDAFVDKLRVAGVNVTVIEDTESPAKPDAVFPNNWISFHENGVVILYPMFSKMRRLERREDVVEKLKEKFKVSKDYTFQHYEDEGFFLEGTGSMLLDREKKIVYACLSPRTAINLLDKWCVLTGYRKVNFEAADANGNEIYHTNVMMALGKEYAVVCLSAITNPDDRKSIVHILENSGKEIIDITFEQMEAFAGNMLQVQGYNSLTVMSSTAYESLSEDQIAKIKRYGDILVGDIPMIEKYGGGSVRCMMAEIFLPLKANL